MAQLELIFWGRGVVPSIKQRVSRLFFTHVPLISDLSGVGGGGSGEVRGAVCSILMKKGCVLKVNFTILLHCIIYLKNIKLKKIIFLGRS